MFGIFRKKREKLKERTLDEIKVICKILFIDDKSFPIADILKKSGWNNIQKIKDVDALDQVEIREAHILFIDIQGVGRKLKLPDEGLGLIIAIKTKYPHKKVIAYSAEDQGQVQAFHEGIDKADSRLSKNASSYEFQFRVEKFAKEFFSLEECVNRVKKMLLQEFGITSNSSEIISNIDKINKTQDFSVEKVSKIFNLQNASNIASVIQLFLNG